MIPVSAPPRVRAHLQAAPDGPVPVLHRGPEAVYVAVAGRCVGLVGRRATAVPCALRTRSASLPPAVFAEVRGGVLHLDDVPLVVGRLVSVVVPRISLTPAPVRLPVRELVGAGDGLTPYGDDVLCGWLAVHRAAGVATPETDAEVCATLHRTTLLSATLLDCAIHGEVVPEFASFLVARGTAREQEATEALLAVGGSSGAGLLEGAQWALGAVAA